MLCCRGRGRRGREEMEGGGKELAWCVVSRLVLVDINGSACRSIVA